MLGKTFSRKCIKRWGWRKNPTLSFSSKVAFPGIYQRCGLGGPSNFNSTRHSLHTLALLGCYKNKPVLYCRLPIGTYQYLSLTFFSLYLTSYTRAGGAIIHTRQNVLNGEIEKINYHTRYTITYTTTHPDKHAHAQKHQTTPIWRRGRLDFIKRRQFNPSEFKCM